MSDVVWAINPKRDTLRDTIRRMRQHAEEVCAGRNIALEFHAPDDQGLRVPIEVRREAFLIFKEAVNNAVRHSHCRTLRVEINVDDRNLHLRVSDDGVGFEMESDRGGTGLTSMRQRAVKIGASLDLVSTPGRGATVSLSARRTPAGRPRYPA
jgi:signal transduction histidine kinase